MVKTALVTGAASGLGYEFSKLLATDGYNLIMTDKNGSALSVAAKNIESVNKNQIETIVIDLSKPNAAQLLTDQINTNPIDVLVNNAGFGLFGFFHSSNWLKESEMIHLQVLNLTHLTKIILQRMREKGQGKILNVSSMAAFQPGPLFSVYAASKAYINSFTLSLANELKGSGISVTLLCPGQTETGFAKSVAEVSGSKLSTVPFTAKATKVAAYGYKAMKKGQILAIPGTVNKLMFFMSKILPATLLASINRRLQERIRK